MIKKLKLITSKVQPSSQWRQRDDASRLFQKEVTEKKNGDASERISIISVGLRLKLLAALRCILR